MKFGIISFINFFWNVNRLVLRSNFSKKNERENEWRKTDPKNVFKRKKMIRHPSIIHYTRVQKYSPLTDRRRIPYTTQYREKSLSLCPYPRFRSNKGDLASSFAGAVIPLETTSEIALPPPLSLSNSPPDRPRLHTVTQEVSAISPRMPVYRLHKCYGGEGRFIPSCRRATYYCVY